MSEENVEIVGRAYRAYQSGGLDAAIEFFHPEIEWKDLDALPDAGSYRGLEELREAVRSFYAAWDDLSFTPEEFIDAGEAVVVAHRWRGSGKSSGTPIDTLTWNVFTLRDGKIVRRQAFQDREQALTAVGLTA
ncbi:MAG: nuclear transport factor 2 family protein [Solirubrobacterales bacterium]